MSVRPGQHGNGEHECMIGRPSQVTMSDLKQFGTCLDRFWSCFRIWLDVVEPQEVAHRFITEMSHGTQ